MSEKDYIRRKNKWLPKIKQWVDKNSSSPSDDANDMYSHPPILPFSCKLESALTSAQDENEKQKYCNTMAEAFGENGKAEIKSILPRIITTGYAALQLGYFFTAGADEVRAWTIRKGTKAPQGAGVIHTDFEKGFIMAEVMKYEELKELGSESAVKAAGKYYQKGKEYVVEDGDIIFFKFNVTTVSKKK